MIPPHYLKVVHPFALKAPLIERRMKLQQRAATSIHMGKDRLRSLKSIPILA
jgi:hypothetical protein